MLINLKYNIVLLALICSTSVSAKDVLVGYVFEDLNANGVMDAGEKGIGGILVSNQEDIVVTDISGKYEISTKKNQYIYVIKPANYAFSTNVDNNWSFYVNVAQTNRTHNFGLTSKEVTSNFSTLMVGDPQMRGEKPINAFKEDIVTEMMHYDVDFACFLGDIADNDLSIYEQEKDIVRQLPYPTFHLFGNHDINEKASTALNASDVFKRSYGPDYYSFNEGDVHFIALNNVLYNGWNKTDNKRGNYFGGLTDRQFNWLKSDLEYVSKDKLIVIMSHIPFLQEYCYPQEIQRLFLLLEGRPHLLALSGHLHYIENCFFRKNTYWNSTVPFQSITIGAACGGWWTGPMDERGLPVSTSVDGSPNGYYKLDFEGNTYKYSFVPANHRTDFQMRITVSSETLDSGKLNNEYLSINIFSATPDAAVKVIIDGREEQMATNYTGKDLFIQNTYDQRYNFDNWQPEIQETKHLWKISLPRGLSLGNHRIKVVATDIDGNEYVGYKIIEIK